MNARLRHEIARREWATYIWVDITILRDLADGCGRKFVCGRRREPEEIPGALAEWDAYQENRRLGLQYLEDRVE